MEEEGRATFRAVWAVSTKARVPSSPFSLSTSRNVTDRIYIPRRFLKTRGFCSWFDGLCNFKLPLTSGDRNLS